MARKRVTKTTDSRPKLYLVQRLSWTVWREFSGAKRPFCEHVNDSGGDDAAGVPVAAFTNRQAAEAAMGDLAAADRAVLCPLMFAPVGELDRLSRCSEKVWAARLRKAGLEPPSEATFPLWEGGVDWRAWWESVVDRLSDEQRQVVWDLCDRVRLYQVVEIVPEA